MEVGRHVITRRPKTNWILRLALICQENNYKMNGSGELVATMAHSMHTDPR